MQRVSDSYHRFRHSWAARTLLPLLSVILAGIYPALYYYTRNAAVVRLSSLARLLPIYLLLIIAVYAVSWWFNKKNTVKAANAAIVFLFFFNTYGILYQFITGVNFIRSDHLTLLPFYVFAGVYFSWLVTRMNKGTSFSLWRFLSIAFGILTAFSVLYIIPHEVEKARLRDADAAQISVNVEPVSGKTPDIYYLIFDEFAGFTSMREYFNNHKAGEFKAYLQDEGFHVFEESRSSDIWSIHQIATRLNYFDYKYVKRHEEKWLYSIANNKAAAFVESKGYTTVFFEEFSWFFPTMPEIRADHVYDIRAFENFALKTLYDDFGMLVVDATMLFPLNHNKEHIKAKYQPLHDFIDYSIERIPNLEEIASPKFVFLHILMPHWPYLVDSAGNPVHPDFYQDWDYYEEYYEYSITVVQNMVDELLANADPENPPVIILQSDHGARALEYKSTLTDYPEEFQSDILFAVFTPGYDASQLPQDLDPINTLPIVFNHYLGADIPLK